MTGDRAEPSLPVPLVRRWGRTVPESVRPLGRGGGAPVGRGQPDLPGPGHTHPRRSIRRRASRPGRPTSAAPPVWVGYLADKIIAATETRLVAPEPRQGDDRLAVRPRRRPRRAGAAPTRSPGPTPTSSAGEPPRRQLPRLPDRRAAGSSACAETTSCWRSTATPGWWTGRSRPAAGDDQPEPLDRPAADRAPGRGSRTPSSCWRPRPAAAAPSIPQVRGRGVGSAPRCRSTTTTWSWWPTAGRSPSST